MACCFRRLDLPLDWNVYSCEEARAPSEAYRRILVAEMKSITLKVEGMHCDACAQTIKSLISAEAGVRAATVSCKDGEERLVGAIEKPGYRVVGRIP